MQTPNPHGESKASYMVWRPYASDLPHIAFNQVFKEANAAAHSLATWSFKNAFVGFFDSSFGPPIFADVNWKEAVSSSLL